MAAPKLVPALLGGLFIGVLSSLPLVSAVNTCCCLWVVTGGMLAAWLMQQNTVRPITIGEGALVGLLVSYIALGKLREQVTTSLANRRGKPEHDVDSDFEDDFVDTADSDVPVARPVSDADRHAARREHDEG